MPKFRSYLSPVRSLYLARLLESAAFSSLMPFVLLHFTESLKLSTVLSGSILGTQEIMPVFTGVAVGWLVTRIGGRFILSAFLGVLASTTFVWMTGFGGTTGLWCAAVASGISLSAVRIGMSSSVADLVTKEEAPHGYALLHAFANVGFAVGPLLNSWWVVRKDYASAFMVPIALYCFAALITGWTLPSDVARGGKEAKESQSIKSAIGGYGSWGMFFLASILLVGFFNGIRLQADLLGLGKYFVDYFHSTKATSLYWTVQSLTVVVLVPWSGRRMKGWDMRSLFLAYVSGMVLIAAGFTSLGYFGPQSLLPAFGALVFLTVIGECLCAPAFGSLLVHFLGSKRAGVAFGLASTITALGMSSGANLAGILLAKAAAIHFLPAYWRWEGALCVIGFVFSFAMGALSLQTHRRKIKAEDAIRFQPDAL